MTKEDRANFRMEFENLLNKYRVAVQDEFYFKQLADYSSDTLRDKEHSLCKNLIEMYCGMLDIVYKCESEGWKNDRG